MSSPSLALPDGMLLAELTANYEEYARYRRDTQASGHKLNKSLELIRFPPMKFMKYPPMILKSSNFFPKFAMAGLFTFQL